MVDVRKIQNFLLILLTHRDVCHMIRITQNAMHPLGVTKKMNTNPLQQQKHKGSQERKEHSRPYLL